MESFRRNLPASLLKIKEEDLAASNERLLLNGFPNSRTEAWKYSRLNRIASLNLHPKNSAPIGWEQYSLTKDIPEKYLTANYIELFDIEYNENFYQY